MTSRREQVQAYGFMMDRLSSALVHGEPDAARPPMRRTTGSAIGGLVLGVLGVMAFFIWGLFSPAGKAVAAPANGTLVVVPQTGASYIYARHELLPVLNWSSARLLLGGNPQVQDETTAAIAGIPQGPPVGIPGAPEALPPMASVNQGDWLVCARPGGAQPRVAVAIGARPAAPPVAPNRADLVAAGDSHYLIWEGRRLRLDAPWIARALGLGLAPVTPVSQAWLNAVPAGPDLRPLSLPGAGTPGPVLAGLKTRVGEVLVAHNMGSPSQLYLVENDGVAVISATQAALALSSSAAAAAYPQPVAVSPAAITSAPVASRLLPDGPGTPPSPPGDDAPAAGDVPCIAYPAAGSAPPSLIWTPAPAGSAPQDAPGVSGAATAANLISVTPGGGALVQPQTATGAAAGPPFLVTGSGVKFPVPTSNDASALGYRTGQAARLPAALLGLLPTGPSLDLPPMQG